MGWLVSRLWYSRNMKDVEEKIITADELFLLPNDPYWWYELQEGRVIRMSPTGGEHGILAMNLGHLLSLYVKAHQLGVVCAAETGFVLRRNPDTVRAPDVAFISSARIPRGDDLSKFWPMAPDLAVEVLSPRDTHKEVEGKVQEYLMGGTALVWVVDPKRRTIQIYDTDKSYTLTCSDTLTGDPILLGFSCPVSEIFDL